MRYGLTSADGVAVCASPLGTQLEETLDKQVKIGAGRSAEDGGGDDGWYREGWRG